MVILLLILSVLLNFTLGFCTWNLLRKNEYAEDFLYQLLHASKIAVENMKEIDSQGLFQWDDEVGVTFRALHYVIQDYNELMGITDEESSADEESTDGGVIKW